MTYFKYGILLFFLFVSKSSWTQSGTWVWLRGDSTTASAGNFGTLGITSPSNEPPANYEPCYWTDKQGNFWMFGGLTYGYGVNNLWKYDPIINQWTWVNGPSSPGTMGLGNFGTQGIPSPLNYPPAVSFGANCWTDSSGDLWLYGSAMTDALWRYHIPTNEWTWMGGHSVASNYPVWYNPAVYGPLGVGGAAYTPGDRAECKAGWTHQNKLYLYGGQDNISFKNDLWSYDISTNLWAWEGGGQDSNSLGNYGVKGVSNATNWPPAKFSFTRWYDSNSFYLFAGSSYDSMNVAGKLNNDVWRYDLQTKWWTWISGTNTINDTGFHSNFCEGNINYLPFSRMENSTVVSNKRCMSAFWTFGGMDSSGTVYNDLWSFNATSNEWTKVKGEASSTFSPYYSYGIKGLPSLSNMPKARQGAALWSDRSGNLYMFGGGNWNEWGVTLNDLWKFIPDSSCVKSNIVEVMLTPLPDTTLCYGETISMAFPSGINITVMPSDNAIIDTILHVINFTAQSNTTYTVIANSSIPNDPCFTNDTVSFSINITPLPIADFEITPQITTLASPTFNLLNQSQHATHYEWYEGATFISTSIDITRTYSSVGKYCFTLIAINDCGDRDSITKCAEIIEPGNIFIPNAFSPNGDGINDVFGPVIIGDVSIKNFVVYNRWGQQIFNNLNKNDGWNGQYKGKDCELGTYFYYIEASDALGKNLIYKGDFMLIR